MKQIKQLQRLLGKKTMENELLKEAVAHVPLLLPDLSCATACHGQ